MFLMGREGVLGDEGRPRASFDTREKDSRGPRERASMKEYSLSSISVLPAGSTTASCCEVIIREGRKGPEQKTDADDRSLFS